MKKVSPLVYEGLTPKQRVVACIEALARGDEDERRHLIRSCPKLIYHQSDACFSESMERLMGLAMAIEADSKELLLRFFVLNQVEPESSQECLQDFANLREAWKMTLNAMGIDEETMASAGPPSSPVFGLFKGFVPTPQKKGRDIFSRNVEMFESEFQFA